jgi:1-acyl-sn-glycerol-3-phosphate acyltransferase
MAALTDFARRGLLYLLLAELGAMSLAWNLVAWVLHKVVPRQAGTSVGRAVIARAYRFFWASARACGMMCIDSSALDALAAEPGGLIVAANHPTMLDALVVVARLPRGVCIMKAELMRNVFLGAGARLARYIRNDSPRGMVRCAVRCLRDGGQLVMFPEGTRTVRAPVNAFRPGITLIAHRAQVPIQAVIIETDTAYLRKGWPIWRAPVFPIVMRVRLGERFMPEGDHQALLDRLERYFTRELAPSVDHAVPIDTVVRASLAKRDAPATQAEHASSAAPEGPA